VNRNTPLLEVSNLRVAFDGKEVVRGIDFTVQPGEKLALVGESGSGKTVTALSLLRLVMHARITGTAGFLGRDLLALPESDLRGIRGSDIAMIFQEPMTALNPLFTVGEQIAEVLELKQGHSSVDAARMAIDLLAETGITEAQRRARAFPHQLSGGQRQRAMIAMALACKPKLLLADEPTTALDVTLRAQILDLLTALQRRNGMAVLLITHDLNLVRRFADRVAVMENGCIVEQGAVTQVFADPRHPYTRRLIDSRPERDVPPSFPDAVGHEPLMRAQALRVTYPVPLGGVRGWFAKGEFVAVRGADFVIPPGQTLGRHRRVGFREIDVGAGSPGLAAVQRSTPGCQWMLAPGGKGQQGLAPVGAGGVPGSVLLAVAAHDHRGNRRRRAAGSRARAFHGTKTGTGIDRSGRGRFGEGPVSWAAGALSAGVFRWSASARGHCRALIVGPEVLVLDEPTSALDVTIQHQILELLQRLQRERGLSYLLITHDMEVIRAMAHDVLVMKDGDVVESGPVMQVLDAPQQAYTRALVVAAA
jgi:microcin C transport system ATP-binding protein